MAIGNMLRDIVGQRGELGSLAEKPPQRRRQAQPIDVGGLPIARAWALAVDGDEPPCPFDER